MYDYDLACIGSGPAGQRAAVQAAKLGKRVVVIEKQRRVGGVCVATGTIPSKTLREAVLTFSARGPGAEARPTAEQLVSRIDQGTRSGRAMADDPCWCYPPEQSRVVE